MDPGLVTRAQRGDQRAFHAVAEAAQPRLYRLAFGVLRDPAAASDATQQALIAIWRYLPRLRDPARFDAWSYRLLVRACSAQFGQSPRWLPDTDVPAGSEPVASDEFLAVLHRDQLERGFGRLSVDHRAVIALRYLLDLPLADVAEALDVSVGTMASRLNRALAARQAALEADARLTPNIERRTAR
jgi:RNA polymerase sigma-70 factor (ECF subfamily)